MKANEIMSKASGALNKIGFGLKKRSPEILVAAGVVGTVVSAVMACKATTKIGTILDETRSSWIRFTSIRGLRMQRKSSTVWKIPREIRPSFMLRRG